MPDPGDGYTIKERIEDLARTIATQLGGIVTQLEAIESKLDQKATIKSIEVVALEVKNLRDDHEPRIKRLEIAHAGSVAVSGFVKFLIGTVAVGCLGSIATLVWLAAGGHP